MLRANNVPFTRDDAFRIFMDRTHWKADARLVRAFVDKTADTIQWLEDRGVRFELYPFFVHPDTKVCTHLVQRPDGGTGPGSFATMMRILKERFEGKKGEIRFSTTVTKIRKEGDRIVGVVAKDKTGTTFQVDAKAVIVGTGGYPHNKAMLKKHGGFEMGRNLWVLPPVTLTGSGIEMAWDVGAVPDGMDVALIYQAFEPEKPGRETVKIGSETWGITSLGFQPWLCINQQGQRFVDEGEFVVQYRANAMARQPNRCAYLIFDDDTRRHEEQEGLDHVSPIRVEMTAIKDVEALFRKTMEKKQGLVFIAKSLGELARQIGVDPAVLQETVDEYNRFCDKGHDDLFAKDPRYLHPVRKPQFYAIKLRDVAYGTVGGIKINERAEAVDSRNEPIPGLYAVGDAANGSMAYDFALAHILQGGPMSFALNVGRIAGENAVKYVRSQDGSRRRRR